MPGVRVWGDIPSKEFQADVVQSIRDEPEAFSHATPMANFSTVPYRCQAEVVPWGKCFSLGSLSPGEPRFKK